MNIKISRHKFLANFPFTIVFLFSNLSLADELNNPEDIVHDFYSAYLKDEPTGNDVLVKKHVSDELKKSINDSTMCNYDSDDSVSESELAKKCSTKHECKKDKGNYICDWYGVWVESDVNYFTKSQDTYPSWQSNINTSTIKRDEDNSVVRLVLGNGAETNNELKVSLRKYNDGWKIISVTE
ncbi:hypothetical protein AFK62_14110 [Cronobacter condimenti 1330]|uniref:DUF3828 domain-containing protein n=1 Tax=Cronobacter condimenti 1330 TaxID=1073999 RepID=A0ABM5VEU5_9ENTR|nr:DUF3828 domain-containing protein [Cronobacter condimenti]ALB63563.1 hypothetical protein AFK62_14110 [Cronobacter condimenti 1330]